MKDLELERIESRYAAGIDFIAKALRQAPPVEQAGKNLIEMLQKLNRKDKK